MSYLYYFCIIYSLVLVTNNTTDFLNVFILCALLSETVGRALSYIDFNFSRRRIFSHVWYHSTSKNSHSLSQIYFRPFVILFDWYNASVVMQFHWGKGGGGVWKTLYFFQIPALMRFPLNIQFSDMLTYWQWHAFILRLIQCSQMPKQGQIGLERSANWSLILFHGPRGSRGRPSGSQGVRGRPSGCH